MNVKYNEMNYKEREEAMEEIFRRMDLDNPDTNYAKVMRGEIKSLPGRGRLELAIIARD